jgi:predicted nucleic acid binding AN1-type Zn finger protein
MSNNNDKTPTEEEDEKIKTTTTTTSVQDIGTHCSIQSCNRLDFLPIKCYLCLSYFCKEHSSYSGHKCPKFNDNIVNENEVQLKNPLNLFPCSFVDCKIKELVKVECDYCMLNFCMKHRLQVDHNCDKQPKSQVVSKEPKPELHFEVKTNVSDKNKALQTKLIIMKLKQTAVGPTGLPEESKYYCFVEDLTKEKATLKKGFFFSKKWPIGRGVEFIFKTLSINISNLSKFKLFYNDCLVDYSLTFEEFTLKNSLEAGIIFQLKNI